MATEIAVALSGARSISREEYWPSATATAAVAADWTISSSDQPWRNATSGWNASRKKAYWPPTRGTTVESSAKTKAPKSAINPPAAQTPRISSGVSTVRATTYGLMKMPEPIMPLMAIMVASNSVRRREKPGFGSLMGARRISGPEAASG